MVSDTQNVAMFIPPAAIHQLMRDPLIGARLDDPVIPERTPRKANRRARRNLRLPNRQAAAIQAHCASTISSSTTAPSRSVTS